MADKKGSIDLTKAYQEASAQLLNGIAKARAPSSEGLVLTVRKLLNTLTLRLDEANTEALKAATEEGKQQAAQNFQKRLSDILNGRAFTQKDLERAGLSPANEAARERIEAAEAKAFKDNRAYRAAFLELRKGLKGAQAGTFQAVNEALKELSESGKNTVQNARKAIVEKLSEQGVFKVKFSNGASVDMAAYASMVARTARTESGYAAYIALGKAHGTGLVECIGNAVTCPVCAQYQRRVYSVDGTDKRFPALYDGPDAPLRHGYRTIHPNCRCEFIPYFEALQTPEELERDIAQSNRPYRDDRTFRQKRDYQEWQAKNRRLRDEYNEYEAMKRTLGTDMPYKTLAGFRRAKRAFTELKNGRALDREQKIAYNNYRLTTVKYKDKLLQTEIKNGKYDLTVHDGKQGKHIRNHNNFIEGKSYLTIDESEVQDLIKRHAGSGVIQRTDSGKWSSKELIVVDKAIGVCVDLDGTPIETNRFMIHYSKSGVHIVPTLKEAKR